LGPRPTGGGDATSLPTISLRPVVDAETTYWARCPSTTSSTTCFPTTGGAQEPELSGAGDAGDSSARQRLTRRARRRRVSFNVDAEAVGNFSESIARYLGTGRYLAWQTILVIVWIALNLFAIKLQWDPYPFILLNLAFSTQAAYAAPLILLAQNRQENRNRVALEEDRRRAEQTKADTEYLARELAAPAVCRRGGHPRLPASRTRGIEREV
jgi:uncharacterized membrane protein